MIYLRNLTIDDFDYLNSVENDKSYWKYSLQNKYYSKDELIQFIFDSQLPIEQTNQIRFVICKSKSNERIGFIDLFDFEPLHQRAGVGLIVRERYKSKGYGSAALDLIYVYAKKYLHLHQLYAFIAIENKISIRLFEGQGYHVTGKKKDWNFYEGRYHDEFIYQKLIE